MGLRRRTGAARAVAAVAMGLLVVGVGVGTPASAAPAESGPGSDDHELVVSGSFTGTGNFASLPECPSFQTWHDGSGDWTGLGAVTFRLDYCVELNVNGPSPLSGTFTITAPAGTLTGTLTGELPSGSLLADYTLTVTGGTGTYDRAGGTLTLAASFDGDVIPIFEISGTVSGTIILALPTPTSVGDCLRGGWRDLADDTGRPFRNQGACVRYALDHPGT